MGWRKGQEVLGVWAGTGGRQGSVQGKGLRMVGKEDGQSL